MTSSALPLVSVLIPCHNAGRWIRQTIESVLAQTWPNIEVIVVDDGSTDDSVAVIESLNSNRVVLERQKNSGAAMARNRAFSASRGEFIQYLDADDLLSPDKIRLQLVRLVDRNDCVAMAEWARFRRDPIEAVFTPDDTWQDLEPAEWLIRAWSDGGGMLYPALWLVPRQIIEDVGPWDSELTLNDDGEFFARVLLASNGVLFCKGARTYYRSGIVGSLSGLKSCKGWESQFRVAGLCQEYLLAREDSERARRACSMVWQRLAHGAYPYNRKLAREALIRARSLHPAELVPEGGRVFRTVMRIAGWKVGRLLQRAAGRP